MRSQTLQPLLIVVMQPRFIIIDEDGRCDVHGVHQNKALPDTTLCKAIFHLMGNIGKSSPCRQIEPKLFPIRLHEMLALQKSPYDSLEQEKCEECLPLLRSVIYYQKYGK